MPQNWTELREKMRSTLDSDLAFLDAAEETVNELIDEEGAWPGAFGGIGERAFRCMVLAGPDRVRSHLRLDPLLEKLVTASGETPADAAPVEVMAIIEYVAVARCMSHPLPAGARDLEARWFPKVAEDTDAYEYMRRSCAFAATAIGAPDLVPVFDKGTRLKARSTTQTIVPMNTFGFARHLAECSLGGGGLDAVEQPWAGYLRVFPIALQASAARWIELFWAAASIMVRFEKRPLTDVATWLPKLIAELD